MMTSPHSDHAAGSLERSLAARIDEVRRGA